MQKNSKKNTTIACGYYYLQTFLPGGYNFNFSKMDFNPVFLDIMFNEDNRANRICQYISAYFHPTGWNYDVSAGYTSVGHSLDMHWNDIKQISEIGCSVI